MRRRFVLGQLLASKQGFWGACLAGFCARDVLQVSWRKCPATLIALAAVTYLPHDGRLNRYGDRACPHANGDFGPCSRDPPRPRIFPYDQLTGTPAKLAWISLAPLSVALPAGKKVINNRLLPFSCFLARPLLLNQCDCDSRDDKTPAVPVHLELEQPP